MGWLDVTDQVTSPLESIAVEGNGGANSTFFGAVEVDGELLVDPGFGSNGFYLPFDPAMTGANYSSKASGVTSFYNSSIENGFDGNPASVCRFSTDGQTLSIDLSEFTGNHTITIDPHQTDGTANTVSIAADDGGSVTTLNSGNVNQGNQVITANVNNLQTVEFAKTDGIHMGFYSISIDNEMLVDHSSIGVDMSGNKNNFHDQNFAVEDIYNYKEGDWMSDSTVDKVSNISKFYNGMFSDTTAGGGNNAATVAANTTGTIEYTNPISFSEKVEVAGVVINDGDAASDIKIEIKIGGSWVNISDNIYPKGSTKYPLNGGFDLVYYEGSGSLQGIRTNGNQRSNTAGLDALIIDGQVYLQNGEAGVIFSQDTVLDTPMKNYAVLETGSNGNLNTDSSQVSTISTTENFYFEAQIISPADALANGGNDYSFGVLNSAGQMCMVNGAGRTYINGSGPSADSVGFTYGNEVVGLACRPSEVKLIITSMANLNILLEDGPEEVL